MLMFASKYRKFWTWFQAHEDEIFHFDVEREKVFDELVAHLLRVHPNLTFEFCSIYEGRREFTVSAGGNRKAFPEVTALVGEAPTSRGRLIAFRQRHDIPEIQFGDKKLNRDAVFFDYTQAGDKIDLTVFIPGLAGGSHLTSQV
jgi:hypothetical protein